VAPIPTAQGDFTQRSAPICDLTHGEAVGFRLPLGRSHVLAGATDDLFKISHSAASLFARVRETGKERLILARRLWRSF
jgi:hypothetical protein